VVLIFHLLLFASTRSAKLLQKVEELKLYVIDLKKENEALKEWVVQLARRLQRTERDSY